MCRHNPFSYGHYEEMLLLDRAGDEEGESFLLVGSADVKARRHAEVSHCPHIYIIHRQTSPTQNRLNARLGMYMYCLLCIVAICCESIHNDQVLVLHPY
jgi:hypothetical protein